LINVKQLKSQLKEKTIKSIYLFGGEETFLVDKYTKEITDMCVDEAFKEFNYSFYNEDNESYDSFFDDVNSYPTMSEKKVVVLKNVGFTKLKDYQKPLCQLVSSLPDYVVVIIVEPEIKKIKKALADEIEEKGEIVEFQKQTIYDLRAWVAMNLGRFGKNIMPADAEYLINLCQLSMEKLNIECEKLGSAEGNTVTKKLIDEMVNVPLEVNIFSMSDEILNGNSKNAYNILKGLKSSKQEPIAILIIMYKQFADLLMFKNLGEENANAESFLAPNRRWLAKKLMQSCRRYSKEKLRLAMKLCAKYDIDIKSGKIDGFTAIEMLLAEILIKN